MHIISLGAGVQSTTMALMAAHGEIEPMPDAAIFADTGWEPKAVYDHLRWLMSDTVLPFPVHIAMAGNIREDLLAGTTARSGTFISIPSHLKQGLNKGIGRRQCTTAYKIEPLMRKTRELLGMGRREPIAAGTVTTWVGISLDEIYRAIPSKVRYQVKRFPLLEQRMTRHDCLRWLEQHGYPTPPKSSCIGCPLHSDAHWREIRKRPEEWQQAVEIDHLIRTRNVPVGKEQYLHQQRVPLDQVDLTTAEDRGQLNLFLNECEGMCGV
jgi:hypothetical protein